MKNTTQQSPRASLTSRNNELSQQRFELNMKEIEFVTKEKFLTLFLNFIKKMTPPEMHNDFNFSENGFMVIKETLEEIEETISNLQEENERYKEIVNEADNEESEGEENANESLHNRNQGTLENNEIHEEANDEDEEEANDEDEEEDELDNGAEDDENASIDTEQVEIEELDNQDEQLSGKVPVKEIQHAIQSLSDLSEDDEPQTKQVKKIESKRKTAEKKQGTGNRAGHEMVISEKASVDYEMRGKTDSTYGSVERLNKNASFGNIKGYQVHKRLEMEQEKTKKLETNAIDRMKQQMSKLEEKLDSFYGEKYRNFPRNKNLDFFGKSDIFDSLNKFNVRSGKSFLN